MHCHFNISSNHTVNNSFWLPWQQFTTILDLDINPGVLSRLVFALSGISLFPLTIIPFLNSFPRANFNCILWVQVQYNSSCSYPVSNNRCFVFWLLVLDLLKFWHQAWSRKKIKFEFNSCYKWMCFSRTPAFGSKDPLSMSYVCQRF